MEFALITYCIIMTPTFFVFLKKFINLKKENKELTKRNKFLKSNNDDLLFIKNHNDLDSEIDNALDDKVYYNNISNIFFIPTINNKKKLNKSFKEVIKKIDNFGVGYIVTTIPNFKKIGANKIKPWFIDDKPNYHFHMVEFRNNKLHNLNMEELSKILKKNNITPNKIYELLKFE